MEFNCIIKLNNAAYRDEYEELYEQALADNIEYISKQIAVGARTGTVMDINGNKVGNWSIK